jgi:chromosome partitioning protein
MITTAIINTKGGVGKTITTVHLGAALAAAGRRVLLCDLDIQHGLSTYFDVEPEGAPTMPDVLLNDAGLSEASREVRENLFVVPATSQMERAEVELTAAPGAEVRLRRAMKKLLTASDFDFALLDCASGWGTVARNALLASDSMLIPINSEPAAMLNAAATQAAAREVGQFYDHDVRLLGVLLTCWRETNTARDVAAQCAEQWGDALFSTKVRRAEKINELSARGETLADLRISETGKLPKGGVGADYYALAQEVIQRCQ